MISMNVLCTRNTCLGDIRKYCHLKCRHERSSLQPWNAAESDGARYSNLIYSYSAERRRFSVNECGILDIISLIEGDCERLIKATLVNVDIWSRA